VTLPLAHVGHYLWVLYLIPVLVVIGGIARTMVLERRRREEERDG
jgi:cytochrome c-type biogenesis protein CcmH/NrfF